ncbi:MFS transporter [Paraburkholderia sacchari]|uniref:MFS transporter n=1 Tax=Paraburkholderia sacchari TaxID=159450 RepID=A0A8T6ZID8_9BURK|nr:MFS transporter [Paraburkholderia sacchari]NLP64253.1 MFS transporter [Paraburkholderia sacchari]
MSDARFIPARTTRAVLLVCGLSVLFEGYDVGSLGAVLPALAADRHWNLTPMQLGALGSYALAGMFFGGMAIGTLGDLLGRRRMLLACVALFSLTMAGAALAPTPFWFGLCRFLGGLGLGGVIPVAAALTIEYSPPARRSFNYGMMYSGYSLGILCAALAAMALLPAWGWRGVMAVGALPLLALMPMALALPESLEYLAARGRIDEASALASRLGVTGEMPVVHGARGAASQRRTSLRDVVAAIFARRRLRATACFWIALFCGMLLVYGLNTWLPMIMRKQGYDLGSSLAFLVVFSLTSACGGVVLGKIADRFGARATVALAYAIGALAIAALMTRNALVVSYALVALAGIGSISASLILTGHLTHFYPSHARGAATGWALSFARFGAMCGPLLGGYIASVGANWSWNFVAFAVTGLVAALAVAALPSRARVEADIEADEADEGGEAEQGEARRAAQLS